MDQFIDTRPAGTFDGILRAVAGAAGRQEAFLPVLTVQNHAANLLPLGNGDLACVWFGGTQEGIPDISAYFSRLPKGASRWTAPVKLSDDPTRSEQNPILFHAPDGLLWLIYTSQRSGNQDTAVVMCRTSDDDGLTWGSIRTLIDEPGTFVRQPPVFLANGDWLLPIFRCRAEPGRKWVGDTDISEVKISSDGGLSFVTHTVPDSTGCVHMNIVELDGGRLVAFFRSRFADHVYRSTSDDRGRTWTPPRPTPLPNNNSSIQAIRLRDGRLAMVYNHASAADATDRRVSLYDDIEDEDGPADAAPDSPPAARRTAFWGAPRAPMSLAVSSDEGLTWPVRHDLETGSGYCMTNNSREKLNRELSYPSIRQTPDGRVHVAYTHFRQAIKYVSMPAID